MTNSLAMYCVFAALYNCSLLNQASTLWENNLDTEVRSRPATSMSCTSVYLQWWTQVVSGSGAEKQKMAPAACSRAPENRKS